MTVWTGAPLPRGSCIYLTFVFKCDIQSEKCTYHVCTTSWTDTRLTSTLTQRAEPAQRPPSHSPSPRRPTILAPGGADCLHLGLFFPSVRSARCAPGLFSLQCARLIVLCALAGLYSHCCMVFHYAIYPSLSILVLVGFGLFRVWGYLQCCHKRLCMCLLVTTCMDFYWSGIARS